MLEDTNPHRNEDLGERLGDDLTGPVTGDVPIPILQTHQGIIPLNNPSVPSNITGTSGNDNVPDGGSQDVAATKNKLRLTLEELNNMNEEEGNEGDEEYYMYVSDDEGDSEDEGDQGDEQVSPTPALTRKRKATQLSAADTPSVTLRRSLRQRK